MIEMEIYYSDLNDDAKAEFDGLFGGPEKHNHDTCQLATYQIEEDEGEGVTC